MSKLATLPDISILLETNIREHLPEDAVRQILASHPFIPIPNILNLRTISHSPHLPPNIVFRSGALSLLPPSDLAPLKDTYNNNLRPPNCCWTHNISFTWHPWYQIFLDPERSRWSCQRQLIRRGSLEGRKVRNFTRRLRSERMEGWVRKNVFGCAWDAQDAL